MVVSFYDFEVWSIIEAIVVLIFGMFFFVKSQETFSKVIRLIASIILLIIAVIKVPMEIQMDMPYGVTMCLIILWMVNAVMFTNSLIKKEN